MNFFVLTTALSSSAALLLRTVVRTKKSLEESSQRAHATFENGADPSGTDRGLNPKLPQLSSCTCARSRKHKPWHALKDGLVAEHESSLWGTQALTYLPLFNGVATHLQSRSRLRLMWTPRPRAVDSQRCTSRSTGAWRRCRQRAAGGTASTKPASRFCCGRARPTPWAATSGEWLPLKRRGVSFVCCRCPAGTRHRATHLDPMHDVGGHTLQHCVLAS